MSIPIDGGRRRKGLVRDIRVSASDPWQSNHFKTLVSAYNRSPWFGHYRDGLEKLFQQEVTWLKDWDSDIATNGYVTNCRLSPQTSQVRILLKLQKWVSIIFASDFVPGKPATVVSDRYPQVFEERHGFVPNLSILDWLFCMGPFWPSNSTSRPRHGWLLQLG